MQPVLEGKQKVNLNTVKLPDFMKGSEKKTISFLIFLIALIIFYTAFTAEMSADGFYMMANWREFLKNGFYTIDPLSMHHMKASLEKWLSCAVIYYIYTYFGLTGVRIALAGLLTVIAFLIYRLCAYTSENKTMSLIFAVIMCFTSKPLMQLRPQSVTALILLIEVLCLEHWGKEKSLSWLVSLPFLSLAEMQFHSTVWPCFFMVLAPYLVDMTKEDGKFYFHFKQKIPLMIITGLCAGSLFINPYGAWSVFYIFRVYGNKIMTNRIAELTPPYAINYVLLIWSIVIVIALLFGNRKCPLRYYLLLFGFLFFGITAQRNLIYITALAGFVPCFLLRDRDLQHKWNPAPLAVIALAITAFMFATYTRTRFDVTENIKEVFTEMEEYGAKPGDNIFCDFDTGSYAEYFGYHPYIDSRAEIYLKSINGEKDVLSEFATLSCGGTYYTEFLSEYNFKYLVVNQNITTAFYQELANSYSADMLFSKNGYTVFKVTNNSVASILKQFGVNY